MRVAVLMMQKNEETLLQPWLRYHSDLFGAENLYVFDNGSSSEIVSGLIAEHVSRGGYANLFHSTKRDFDNKGKLFVEYVKLLDQA